jgi:hypothetical protein
MGTVFGSVAFSAGHPSVQSTSGYPAGLEGPGYCASEPKQSEPTELSDRDGNDSSVSNTIAQSGNCPNDMVEVEGDYCQVVEQICEDFISEKRDRCARYKNRVRCLGKTKSLHFCVDKYEYPNEVGQKPTVAVSFDDAAELCAAEGKRLCTAEEWTQACEGPEHLPYTYGFERNSEACNHDKPYIFPDDFAYQNPETRAAEVARVSQSEPSGSRPLCVSSYGVFDMTGNVDEWVLNESGSTTGPEFQSGLKGGYWGPVRNRCRPMTTDHNHWHHGYQIGFRCCKAPGLPTQPQELKPPTMPRNVTEAAPVAVEEVSRS